MRRRNLTPSRKIAQRVTSAREDCIRRYMTPRAPRFI
jgi:hypothetical protein